MAAPSDQGAAFAPRHSRVFLRLWAPTFTRLRFTRFDRRQ
jgi:hypothetical protein